MDIEGFHEMLDALMDEIPEDILVELNGGVIVLPEAKLHPEDADGCLYTMGEYHVQIPGLGRYVAIYFGSFERIFGKGFHMGRGRLRDELRKTLRHELRHHLESLAGERDLEIEDAYNIEAYHLRRARMASGETGDKKVEKN